MLPSQYPTSSHSLSFSPKKKKKSREGLSASGQLHQRSTSSPHKSFDAFLKDTNDEWCDELGYDNIPKDGGAISTATLHSSSSTSTSTTPQQKVPSSLSSPPPPFSSPHTVPSSPPSFSKNAVLSLPTGHKRSSLPAGGIKADIEQRIEGKRKKSEPCIMSMSL